MEHELIIGKYTLESLTNGMFSSPMDMFREYIQNSVDSFDDAMVRNIERENALRIDISMDDSERRITNRDNGCGIPAGEAVATLLDIGNSQKSRSNFRGFRGIGSIANSRRDGFEKNTAYYELIEGLKEWTLTISKEIRHVSYERSLTGSKKAIAEAEKDEDVDLETDLYAEDIGDDTYITESSIMDQSESDELSETDYLSKLFVFLNQKKAQTKYTALNINPKLTMEQRRV